MTTTRERLNKLCRDPRFAKQATGCEGAGDYAAWARAQGYPYCEVFDWTSSAGDWTFIVSPDGLYWQIMSQTNRYPRPGFDREIEEEEFCGTAEEVLELICKLNSYYPPNRRNDHVSLYLRC